MRIDRVALAAEMARKDINQKRLAELSGVSRATLSAIRGGKACSPDTARKLAQVLGNKIIVKEV